MRGRRCYLCSHTTSICNYCTYIHIDTGIQCISYVKHCRDICRLGNSWKQHVLCLFIGYVWLHVLCLFTACIYIYRLHVRTPCIFFSLDLVEPRSTAFEPEQPFPGNLLHVPHLGRHPFVWPPCDCKDCMNPNFFLKWHHAGRSILPRPAATVYRSSTLFQVCSKNIGRCTFYGSFIAPKKVLWKTWMHHVFPGVVDPVAAHDICVMWFCLLSESLQGLC